MGFSMRAILRYAGASAIGLIVAGFNTAGAIAGGNSGGQCCADLEERVAELEATTVRKGNRKLSLKISGQVNKMLLFWDDGVEDNVYVLDNSVSSTRFRFKGSAAVSADLKAGFLIEIELLQAGSATADQFSSDNSLDSLGIRRAAWYIKSGNYGKLTVGHYSPATDDIILLNYGGTSAIATSDTPTWNGGFFLRNSANGNTWNQVLSGGFDLDTARGDVIRYDSPTLAGFVLSASWGDDDTWDIALRWKGSAGRFRIAAGIGYYSNTGSEVTINGTSRSLDLSEIKGSTSIVHVPTGLYVTGAYLGRDRDVAGGSLEDSRMYYIQAGIKKRVFSLGATTLFTEYSNNEDFGTGIDFDGSGSTDYLSSKVDVWGIGIVQRVDRAGMEVYAVYRNFDSDLEETARTSSDDNFSSVAIGARLKF